jgi:hypothetical protein
MAKVVGIGLITLLFAPATLLLGMGALFNPAAQSSCMPRTSTASTVAATVPETARVVFPLPAGTWVRTSGFGMRVHPITGVYKLHTGVDLAAPLGTPILAAADGRVLSAGPALGWGNLVLIEHRVTGRRIVTAYPHMTFASIRVRAGDQVTAGQQIASVGTTGLSTGPHLHFELRPGGPEAASVDPEPWLAAQGAVTLSAVGRSGADEGCGPGRGATPFSGDNPGAQVDDPTTGGTITARTAFVLAQIRDRFDGTAWSCYAPRPGQPSEHSQGRACDGTFGNSIGTAATGAALDLGWQVTNWLIANAQNLGIEYLIFQRKIWSVARAAEGWRVYDGGGMYDPTSVTGGHYDHLHFTVAGIASEVAPM